MILFLCLKEKEPKRSKQTCSLIAGSGNDVIHASPLTDFLSVRIENRKRCADVDTDMNNAHFITVKIYCLFLPALITKSADLKR